MAADRLDDFPHSLPASARWAPRSDLRSHHVAKGIKQSVLGRCSRWIANSRLLQHRSHSVEQEVEWMYALDIHSNSFFPLFIWLYVVQVSCERFSCLYARHSYTGCEVCRAASFNLPRIDEIQCKSG